MFDGEIMAGPCPVLFSPDIEASTAALAADIPKSHYNLQRISKAYFCHEDVMLKDALAVVKKPRYTFYPVWLNKGLKFMKKLSKFLVIFSSLGSMVK